MQLTQSESRRNKGEGVGGAKSYTVFVTASTKAQSTEWEVYRFLRISITKGSAAGGGCTSSSKRIACAH